MNFSELNSKLGGGEIEKDWHQAKGGGWIHKSAKVDDGSKITENAIVWGQVSGDARVYGDAWVYGNARVYGDAWVYGNARVYGDAQVFGNARVYGNAQVSGDARVSGDAWVFGNAWKQSPLFIIGSRYSLTNAKKGHILIGCKCETFDWWLKNGESLAKENGFTKSEIEEYRALVNLFVQIGK